jgi:hypothetical protein
MLVAFFLFEAFKEDACAPVLPIGAYASTVRRRLIDMAGKIISTGGKSILKVSLACMESLGLTELFNRCRSAPTIE